MQSPEPSAVRLSAMLRLLGGVLLVLSVAGSASADFCCERNPGCLTLPDGSEAACILMAQGTPVYGAVCDGNPATGVCRAVSAALPVPAISAGLVWPLALMLSALGVWSMRRSRR